MRGTPGGIIEKEMPFSIFQYCAMESSGKTDRTASDSGFWRTAGKVRYFKSNDEVVDV